jgi:hypothetical protein
MAEPERPPAPPGFGEACASIARAECFTWPRIVCHLTY